MQKMSASDFYNHLERIKHNTDSFKILYDFCLEIIKKHLIYKFGQKAFDTFLYNVPHDVFTEFIYRKPPDNYLTNPSGYLCRSAYRHVLSVYNRMDNRTVELAEDVEYVPDYKERLEFSSPEIERAWDALDEQSRYILYSNVVEKYRLKEIAAIMDLKPACVRQKKSRALKELKAAVKKSKKNLKR